MSVPISNRDYDRIIELVSEMKERIEELESLIFDEEDEEVRPKYRLLLRIHEEGGVVSKDKFNELAYEVGYPDLRGPQGMFAYGGKYVTRIGENRVGITPRGIERLRQLGLI